MDNQDLISVLPVIVDYFHSETDCEFPSHLLDMINRPDHYAITHADDNKSCVIFNESSFYLEEGDIDDTGFNITMGANPNILITSDEAFDPDLDHSAVRKILIYSRLIEKENVPYFFQMMTVYDANNALENFNEETAIHLIQNPTVTHIKDRIKTDINSALNHMSFAQNFCIDLMDRALQTGAFSRSDFNTSQNAFYTIIAGADNPDPGHSIFSQSLNSDERNNPHHYLVACTQAITLLIDKHNASLVRTIYHHAHDALRIALKERNLVKSNQSILKMPLNELMRALRPEQITVPAPAKPTP